MLIGDKRTLPFGGLHCFADAAGSKLRDRAEKHLKAQGFPITKLKALSEAEVTDLALKLGMPESGAGGFADNSQSPAGRQAALDWIDANGGDSAKLQTLDDATLAYLVEWVAGLAGVAPPAGVQQFSDRNRCPRPAPRALSGERQADDDAKRHAAKRNAERKRTYDRQDRERNGNRGA
ncbi:MAG TPA: hypothetical protein VEL76_26135 [Gemmataceae bacterium]|nr:hypothetical protein [Gemmataceae bacterium]